MTTFNKNFQCIVIHIQIKWKEKQEKDSSQSNNRYIFILILKSESQNIKVTAHQNFAKLRIIFKGHLKTNQQYHISQINHSQETHHHFLGHHSVLPLFHFSLPLGLLYLQVLRSRDDFKDGNLFLNVETLANLNNPSYANYKCFAIFLWKIQRWF